MRATRRSESGSIIILTALSMFVVLGIVAFAVDASYLYTERNRLAAAADAAAKSAAIEDYRSGGTASLQAFADREVEKHGLDPAGSTTVAVRRLVDYQGEDDYVEVTVSRPTGTFFSRILGGMWTSVTPVTRAVAGPSASPNCLVALDQAGTLTVGGSSPVNAPGCDIVGANNLSNSGNITAAGIGVRGSCSGNCPSAIQTGIAPPSDPLANISEPTDPGSLGLEYQVPQIYPAGPPNYVLSPGHYQRIDIGPGLNVTLLGGGSNNGLYWISGPITVQTSSYLHGTDVTLFFAGPGSGSCSAVATAGCLDVQGSASVALSAPASGVNKGIVFFQSRTNSIENHFGTNDFGGLVYAPRAAITLGDTTNSSGCTLLVAGSITFNGPTASLANNCAAYGGSPLRTLSLAE